MSIIPSYPAQSWRDQVVAGFERELDRMIESHEIQEFTEQSAAAVISASSERALEVSQAKERFGVFSSSSKAAEKLGGISRQALSARVQNSTLLRVTTADGVHAFPAFQFRNGDVPGPMKKIFKTLLPAAPDPWVVLYWMTSPLADFEGRTAIDVINDGDWQELKLLKAIAQDDAAGWSNQ